MFDKMCSKSSAAEGRMRERVNLSRKNMENLFNLKCNYKMEHSEQCFVLTQYFPMLRVKYASKRNCVLESI